MTPTDTTPAEALSEREAFEKWHFEQYGLAYNPYEIQHAGRYHGWQARGAYESARPTPQPEADKLREACEVCDGQGWYFDHMAKIRCWKCKGAEQKAESDAGPEAVLPYDVKAGSTIFRKGMKLQTLIDAANRWHAEASKSFLAGVDVEEAKEALSFAGEASTATVAAPEAATAPTPAPAPEAVEKLRNKDEGESA